MNNPLREALEEVLSFQSSGKSPTIHDYGRWRRALATPSVQPPVRCNSCGAFLIARYDCAALA